MPTAVQRILSHMSLAAIILVFVLALHTFLLAALKLVMNLMRHVYGGLRHVQNVLMGA